MKNSQLVKIAFNPAIKKFIETHPKTMAMGTGVGLAGLTDAFFYGDDSVIPGVGTDPASNMDKHKAIELIMSTISGAGAASVKGLGLKTLIASLPATKILAGNANKMFKEETEAAKQNSNILPAALGLGAAGLLGYLGLNAYDRARNSNPSEANRDVALTIPGSKISDKFFNNLSREMLFYTPQQKKERIAELIGTK